MQNSIFISFEGIDGAGKSTHIAALADALRHTLEGTGRHVVLTREPGGTPLAETLRELVLHQSMDALTEALLIFAARRDHLHTVIEPALARGDIVLCDRFTDATFAYQGAGRGFDLQVLGQLERWVQAQPNVAAIRQPDMTVWFDLPAAVAAQRLASARVPDRFESMPEAFFACVADGYAQRAAAAPQRFARINADQPPQAVRLQVMQAVRDRGWIA